MHFEEYAGCRETGLGECNRKWNFFLEKMLTYEKNLCGDMIRNLRADLRIGGKYYNSFEYVHTSFHAEILLSTIAHYFHRSKNPNEYQEFRISGNVRDNLFNLIMKWKVCYLVARG